MLIKNKCWLKSLWSYHWLSPWTERWDNGCPKGEAAMTAPHCSQLQAGQSTPVALRPSSQQIAAGINPRTFSTCMPEAGALTNWPTSYYMSHTYLNVPNSITIKKIWIWNYSQPSFLHVSHHDVWFPIFYSGSMAETGKNKLKRNRLISSSQSTPNFT